MAAGLLVACKGKQNYSKEDNVGHTNDELKLNGDKTVYGLACEGCTDSVIVLLPNDGSDPVTYDIIDAFQQRRIIGRPRIGDWIGLVLSKEDNKTADLVIDLDQLKGTWCYKVTPNVKARPRMGRRSRTSRLTKIPDSARKRLTTPREYGFSIKSHWTASAVIPGNRKGVTNRKSLVSYPPVTHYTAWHIFNGRLVLTSGTIKLNANNSDITYTNLKNDTADFILMRRDTLTLKFKDKTMGYYRKESNK